MKAAWLAPALLLAGPVLSSPVLSSPAWAGSVTIVNGGAETIRQVLIAPVPGGGENRLRSTLPPGAQARIGYSTGCQASVRLVFDSGRSEDFVGVDPCTDPRITAGGGAAGPAVAATAKPVAASTSMAPGAVPGGASVAKSGAAGAGLPVKAPPPVVPPWTGKSITKRFGGMD